MPTPLDRAFQSKNAVLAFGAAVGAAALYSIWGSDLFPGQQDPTGDPETWEISELRKWLSNRNLLPSESLTREQLIERVKANLRPARSS